MVEVGFSEKTIFSYLPTKIKMSLSKTPYYQWLLQCCDRNVRSKFINKIKLFITKLLPPSYYQLVAGLGISPFCCHSDFLPKACEMRRRLVASHRCMPLHTTSGDSSFSIKGISFGPNSSTSRLHWSANILGNTSHTSSRAWVIAS